MPTSSPTVEPLPLPAQGAVTRVRRGRQEFVLERARGAWLLVVHDGAQGQRYHLGLPANSGLELRPAAPTQIVDVQLEDGVALAPGGRVRGSVMLPLLTRLVWTGAAPDGKAREEELLCVLPREYSSQWTEGACRHLCTATFLPHGTTPWCDGLLQVPVSLRNDSEISIQPAAISLSLGPEDLNVCRGRLVARPRRIVHRPDGSSAEIPRPWTPVFSATIHPFPGGSPNPDPHLAPHRP